MLDSAGAKLTQISSFGAGSTGIWLGGSGHKVKKSVTINGTGTGFRLSGDGGHHLSASTSVGGHFGVLVETDDNKVVKNRVYAAGFGNSITRNVGGGSTPYDFNNGGSCGTNVWTRNAGTKGPGLHRVRAPDLSGFERTPLQKTLLLAVRGTERSRLCVLQRRACTGVATPALQLTAERFWG